MWINHPLRIKNRRNLHVFINTTEVASSAKLNKNDNNYRKNMEVPYDN
jgi:hypothetical protein